MKYLIMSSPRTGSTMLGAALNATGHAGTALEYFHEKMLAEKGHPEQTKDGMLAYYAAVVEATASANGVFGMKLHFNQFHNIFGEQRFGMRSGASFVKSFDRHVLIYRRDKIMQAISEMLAMEAHLWNSADRTASGTLGRPFSEKDVPLIARIMNRQVAEEYAWRQLMRDLSITPHEVAYEDLVATPDAALGSLAAYLGIPGMPPLTTSRDTVKLTDQQATRAIKGRFLAAIGAAGAGDQKCTSQGAA